MRSPTEIGAEVWHEKVFNEDVNIGRTYRKLLEEVGELGEALINDDTDAIVEEAGDVIMVMMHIIRAKCPDDVGIDDVAAKSLSKCQNRQKPDLPA